MFLILSWELKDMITTNRNGIMHIRQNNPRMIFIITSAVRLTEFNLLFLPLILTVSLAELIILPPTCL
jgi:hypothetical protein